MSSNCGIIIITIDGTKTISLHHRDEWRFKNSIKNVYDTLYTLEIITKSLKILLKTRAALSKIPNYS